MHISDLSVPETQLHLLREVSVAILAITLREFRQNAQQMQQLLETSDKITQSVSDPAIGHQVDLTA